MFDKHTRVARLAVGLAGLAIVVGACGGGSGDKYSIGYSNGGGVGNGFREEQVCTAKAEALSSEKVETLTTIHRNTDAAGQLADIRDLIAKGVKAIVFNPNDPEALNPALEEAKAAGITTVSVDAFVTNPDTYNLYNNQVEYAYLGAKWLFEKLGGKGNVYYMRGFAGHPADTDRHTGFQKALSEFPDIVVLPTIEGEHTQWDSAKATELMNNWIASGKYDETNGIWTSGMDQEIVDAIKAAGKNVRAGRRRGPRRLREPAPRRDGFRGPRRRGRHQHRRRRRRGHLPGAQAPRGREGRDRCLGTAAEHRAPRAGGRFR